MPNPHLCEIVVLLDRSGSMASIKDDMEKGFNSFVHNQSVMPGDCVLTFVQFDTQGTDTVYIASPLKAVAPLKFLPRGGTPLLDATADTIIAVGERLQHTDEERRPGRLLFLIITDGEENSSRRYTRAQVREMIEHQTNVYKWQFSYLGANVDAFAEAASLGIPARAAAAYAATSRGVGETFSVMSSSVGTLRSNSSATLAYSDEERKKMLDKTANAAPLTTTKAEPTTTEAPSLT